MTNRMQRAVNDAEMYMRCRFNFDEACSIVELYHELDEFEMQDLVVALRRRTEDL